MKPKQYPCICPVCGKQHEVTADFMSGGTALRDGKLLILHTCGEHTPEELRAAFHGRKEEA
jgi:hypothetical protein